MARKPGHPEEGSAPGPEINEPPTEKISYNTCLDKTELELILRPLLLLKKICGLLYYPSKQDKANAVLKLYSFLLGLLYIYDSIRTIVSIPYITGNKFQLDQTGSLIVKAALTLQISLYYLTVGSRFNAFAKLSVEFKLRELSYSKTIKCAVLFFVIVDTALFLLFIILLPLGWSVPGSHVSMVQRAKPIPSTSVWAWILMCVSSFLLAFTTVLKLIMVQFLLLFYYIMTKEFHAWKRTFVQSVATDGSINGDIEESRLKFEKLCQLLKRADQMLSPYIAVECAITIPALCFLIYLLLSGVLQPEELKNILGSTFPSMASVAIIVLGGCWLNDAVSTHLHAICLLQF